MDTNSLPSDDDQETPLLNGEKIQHPVSKTIPPCADNRTETTNKVALGLITCVPVIFMSAKLVHYMLIDQFVYHYFAKSLFVNVSKDTTKHPCANESSENSTDQVRQVQDKTSELKMYFGLTVNGLSMFATLIMGAYSDVISRRLLLLIPLLGYLVNTCCFVVVVFWDLSANWLFLGNGVCGASGGVVGLYMAIYIYTSDITPRDGRRVLAIAILEGVKGLFEAAFEILGGILIQQTGFLLPGCISAGLMAIVAIMVLCLPDHKPGKLSNHTVKKDKGTVRNTLKKMLYPYMFHPVHRIRAMMLLSTIAFFLIMVVRVGIYEVRTLYLMNMPFCFDATTLGWYGFGRDILSQISVIMGVLFLYRRLPGILLAIVGSVSMMGGYILLGLATNTIEIFFAPLVAIAQSVPSTVIRGESSKILDAELQGPLFAGFAVAEGVAFLIGPVLFISLYRVFLNLHVWFIWMVAVAFVVCCIIPLCWFHVLWRRHFQETPTRTLTAQVIDEATEEESTE